MLWNYYWNKTIPNQSKCGKMSKGIKTSSSNEMSTCVCVHKWPMKFHKSKAAQKYPKWDEKFPKMKLQQPIKLNNTWHPSICLETQIQKHVNVLHDFGILRYLAIPSDCFLKAELTKSLFCESTSTIWQHNVTTIDYCLLMTYAMFILHILKLLLFLIRKLFWSLSYIGIDIDQ